ncbi:hypothetical protein [Paenibacillus polymyxa]|uniref:hypothetical protein n=1 Tax=Paenibacillus polymyxa TaxID=1406 RepID=UPI00111995A4|nr:hypothetical protein [Paenibacillus polymyxa]QDA30201.1 hypothetical protein FGY93_25110 [Paenibacillus polymyxa]
MLPEILNIIYKHADPPRVNGDAIGPSAIMFSYGETDAFKKMAEDIEDTFKVKLPAMEWDQVGEQSVKDFIQQIENVIYKCRCG